MVISFSFLRNRTSFQTLNSTEWSLSAAMTEEWVRAGWQGAYSEAINRTRVIRRLTEHSISKNWEPRSIRVTHF